MSGDQELLSPQLSVFEPPISAPEDDKWMIPEFTTHQKAEPALNPYTAELVKLEAMVPVVCSQVHEIQDTKTFPKCCVGRNGKQKQQKLHIQVCGSLKTQRNQGCQG